MSKQTDDVDQLFKMYHPRVLKQQTLIDKRFIKTPAWSDSQYSFNHPEFYSTELMDAFQVFFSAAVEYLSGNPLKYVGIKYDLWEVTIKQIARRILEKRTMEDQLRERIGYKGKLGLDLAKAELQIFAIENKRYPRTRDGFEGIEGACKRGEWKQFGINKWGDLFKQLFGEGRTIKVGRYSGELRLKEIMEELKAFRMKIGRLPSVNDSYFSRYAFACMRGTWNLYGINCWNDLLMRTFGEVNVQHDKYQGIEGLRRYQKIARKFAEEKGRIPTVRDNGMSDIRWAITRGCWIEYGIRIWHDFIVETFGDQKNKPKRYYSGALGCQRAKEELLEIARKIGRIPSSKHPGMHGIKAQLRRGGWKEQNIHSWKQLIETVFSVKYPAKKPVNYYSGKNGLQNVVSDIQNFEKIHNRLPKTEDDDFSGVSNAFNRGEWISDGIKTWNDLLKYATGRINHANKLYEGIEGLNLAKEKLRKFKEENGRLPRYGDKGMGGIAHAANNGYWLEFGINNRQDLLRATFGEVNKCGRRKKIQTENMRLF